MTTTTTTTFDQINSNIFCVRTKRHSIIRHPPFQSTMPFSSKFRTVHHVAPVIRPTVSCEYLLYRIFAAVCRYVGRYCRYVDRYCSAILSVLPSVPLPKPERNFESSILVGSSWIIEVVLTFEFQGSGSFVFTKKSVKNLRILSSVFF
jgi:hypothetical protein